MKRCFALIAFLILGCATGPTHQTMKERYDPRIGVMTYDDALSELGIPADIASGAEFIVATWKNVEKIGVIIPGKSIVIQKTKLNGHELTLYFDALDATLVKWRFIRHKSGLLF